MNGHLAILSRVARGAIAVVMLLTASSTSAADTALSAASDLAADAKSAAQSGFPLIVLVSLAGCPHCEVVRRSHLLPLLQDGATKLKPSIRQVEINGREILLDFMGRKITHAEFAKRYKISIAPVVLFFDANGALLAEPLVGSMIPDFYGAYFDAALDEAKSKLRTARREN